MPAYWGCASGHVVPLFFVVDAPGVLPESQAVRPPVAAASPTPFYFLRCESALAAADLDAADVRPSRKTCDAAEAACAEVRSLFVRLWVKALPAAMRELRPALSEASTFAAARAAFGPVDFDIAIFPYRVERGGDGMPPPDLHQQRTKKLHAS